MFVQYYLPHSQTMFSDAFPAIGDLCWSIFNCLGLSRRFLCMLQFHQSVTNVIRIYLSSPVGTESKCNTGPTGIIGAVLHYQRIVSWIPCLVCPHLGVADDYQKQHTVRFSHISCTPTHTTYCYQQKAA